ncbi:MAG: hypothetical protein DI570_00770 [Phenylobacterium zucineum]|nr:MAG: hypothetical protein DI570_00770 [Phenylobacterium zucineum]
MSIRSPVKIELDAGEIGWVQFKLQVGEDAFEHHISDLTDALGDLLRATLQIVSGGFSAECVFDLEPGPLSLRLERGLGKPMVPDTLSLSVRRLDVLAFSAVCASETFGEAVLALANGLFEAGPDRFHDRWDQPFPSRAHAALRIALATPGV